MNLQLKLLIKERYLPILLSILLFLSINISFYNHITLGKENDDDDDNNNRRDSIREDDVIEKDEEDKKNFEDISINELFDNKDNEDDDNSIDNSREDDVIEKDEEEDDVPFILPFNAVPFP